MFSLRTTLKSLNFEISVSKVIRSCTREVRTSHLAAPRDVRVPHWRTACPPSELGKSSGQECSLLQALAVVQGRRIADTQGNTPGKGIAAENESGGMDC